LVLFQEMPPMSVNPIRMLRYLSLGALILGPLVVSGAAQAQSVRLLGDFHDWSAYATSDDAGQMCFALSKPTQTDPQPDGYGQAYLYLTHRPAQGIRDEFNLVAGYQFGPDTAAVLSVGGHNFQLFTEADAAWLEDANESGDLASQIRAGSTLEVDGTTDQGIKITQVFSLSGATAASHAIDAACG
jgi:hypothetical protein